MSPPQLRQFEYKDVVAATKNWTEGCEGHFSATLDGSDFIIKRFPGGKVDETSFVTELSHLSTVIEQDDHHNVASVVGYSHSSEHCCVIFRSASGGDVETNLAHLPWTKRVCIAYEAAQALKYLHSCNPSVIHGNFRAQHVLLDTGGHASVCCFGLPCFGADDMKHDDVSRYGDFLSELIAGCVDLPDDLGADLRDVAEQSSFPEYSMDTVVDRLKPNHDTCVLVEGLNKERERRQLAELKAKREEIARKHAEKKKHEYKAKTQKTLQQTDVVIQRASEYAEKTKDRAKYKQKKAIIGGTLGVVARAAVGDIPGAIVTGVDAVMTGYKTQKVVRESEELQECLNNTETVSVSEFQPATIDEYESLTELELYDPEGFEDRVESIQDLLNDGARLESVAKERHVAPVVLLEFIDAAGIEVSPKIISHLHHCYVDAIKENDVETARKYLKLRHIKGIASRLEMSSRTYGRSAEIKSIVDIFERNASGEREILLVCGYSGVGKTSVIEQARPQFVARGARFVSGKFDQFQRAIPYTAIRDAFNELVSQLLGEDLGAKDRLQEAVSPNGQILVDVIPRLELLIGSQPPAEKLDGEYAQNRFRLVFQNFVEVLTSCERPLILFLDDLQWADDASLKLLAALASDTSAKGLMIVGAYRDNEVDEFHTLSTTLAKINTKVTRIPLTALKCDDVNHWVADSLLCDSSRTVELTKLIFEKTLGNPFFVKQFLNALNEEGCLYFDDDSREWNWSMEMIINHDMTDNVLDLLCHKIEQLSGKTQEVLSWAACIGREFDKKLLSAAMDEPEEQIDAYLHEALDEELIVPGYYFAHDQVQKSAYNLLSEDQQAENHLKLGRLMLEQTPDKVFDVADQLNAGFGLIEDDEEKKLVCRMNSKAAENAKEATAYAAALKYSTAGIEQYPGDMWGDNYETAFAIHMVQCECKYMCGDSEGGYSTSVHILGNTNAVQDKVDVYCVQIDQLTSLGRYDDAVESVLSAAKVIGHEVPSYPSKVDIAVELMKVKWNYWHFDASKLLHGPEDTESKRLMFARLIAAVASSLFMSGRFDLLAWGPLYAMNLIAGHGSSTYTGSMYMNYAMLLDAGLGDYSSGNRYAKLALKLLDRYPDDSYFCGKGLISYGGLISIWHEPLNKTLHYLERALQACLLCGDVTTAGYVRIFLLYYNQYLDVDELADGFKEVKTYVREKLMMVDTALIDLCYHYFVNVHGETYNASSLSIDSNDDTALLSCARNNNAVTELCYYYLFRSMTLYMYEEYLVAFEMATHTENNIIGLYSIYHSVQHAFYYFLIATALYPTASPTKRKEYNKVISSQLKKMFIWAKNCFENFGHMVLLMKAELARISGNKQKIDSKILAGYTRVTGTEVKPQKCVPCSPSFTAESLYDMAIESAKSNGFLQYEALCNELAAKYYLHSNKKMLAKMYMQEARRCYSNWKAHAKVAHLDEKYADLLVEQHSSGDERSSCSTSTRFSNKIAPDDSSDLTGIGLST